MYSVLAVERAASAWDRPEVETPPKSIVWRPGVGEVKDVPRESSWFMSVVVRPEDEEEEEEVDGGVEVEGFGGGDMAPPDGDPDGDGGELEDLRERL